MNKYIIPVCEIEDSYINNLVIYANSYESCQDKIMQRFEKYSDSDDYEKFLKDLDEQDILIGEIKDIETI